MKWSFITEMLEKHGVPYTMGKALAPFDLSFAYNQRTYYVKIFLTRAEDFVSVESRARIFIRKPNMIVKINADRGDNSGELYITSLTYDQSRFVVLLFLNTEHLMISCDEIADSLQTDARVVALTQKTLGTELDRAG